MCLTLEKSMSEMQMIFAYNNAKKELMFAVWRRLNYLSFEPGFLFTHDALLLQFAWPQGQPHVQKYWHCSPTLIFEVHGSTQAMVCRFDTQ